MADPIVPIPEDVGLALDRLLRRGYRACPVGGCVRDSLLGSVPEDWDICTSALPEETVSCFSDCRTIPTGLKHGTVTVLWGARRLEITTFRSDGTYSDHRRPDSVRFGASLEEDLARRDLTVNAMALERDGRVVDPFGGLMDLRRGLLRCVGDPETRYREDALRILRTLRFASRLGFRPEPETLAAALRCRSLLDSIAPERICSELMGFLGGGHAETVLAWGRDILTRVLPELGEPGPEEGRRLSLLPPDPELRLALLLRGENGEKAANAMKRLHTSRASLERVRLLAAEAEDGPPGDRVALGLRLGRTGAAAFRDALLLWRAMEAALPERLDRLEAETERLLAAGFCFRGEDLAVSGGDLSALGLRGREIGVCMKRLLEEVQTGRLENSRPALLAAAERMTGGADGGHE
jgi:tRNA nucleotidyltransferase (CCA-adding enzyme)